MNRSVCPYLGTLDKDEQPGPAIEYPSLENQCFAAPAEALLLLGDQASYCLSGGHRHCPRYQAVQRDAAAASPAEDLAYEPPDIEVAHGGLATADPGLFGNLVDVFEGQATHGGRRWAWIGAAALFLLVFLCGGSFAAYTGWQLINARYLAAAPGEINTLNSSPANSEPTPQQPLFLVVTATAQAPAAPPVVAEPAVQTPIATQPSFPPAVTPTPVVIDPDARPQVPANSGEPLTDTAANLAEAPPASSENELPDLAQNVVLPTPELNLQLEIPTRRPTPIFDVPTSTPEPNLPTPTPTTVPILGTPMVRFAPLQHELQEGQCTLLRWHVENVQAVYYENQGVNGIGEREECIDDEPETFTLVVILPDGNTDIYTTTVNYLPPTPTPTPTPSFTPIRDEAPTPTWTPNIPTETPTPPPILNVGLEIFGESRRICSPGSSCEFDLLARNSGNQTDGLLVTFVQTGAWPALLCEDNGNCSATSLALSAVSANSAKLVKLKVSVPADATAQTAAYAVQVISSASGGSVTSSAQTLEVEVQ
ncbi:MAG: hypothetical protein DCC55_19795 [Chloroflexi bacterium]|nr:MAG: hypothetical protein DCC55_19795 [Chloroflexota bacterium]